MRRRVTLSAAGEAVGAGAVAAGVSNSERSFSMSLRIFGRVSVNQSDGPPSSSFGAFAEVKAA